MRVRRFASVGDFADAVEDHLLADEAANNLLLGVIGELADVSGLYAAAPYLAAAVVDGDAVLVAMRTPPFGAILSQPRHSGESAAVAAQLLAEDLAHSQRDLPGVMGPAGVAAAFTRAWLQVRGGSTGPPMRQRIFRAHEVSAPAGVAGAWRLATGDEEGRLRNWLAAFHAEAFPPGTPQQPLDAVVGQLVGGLHRRAYLWFAAGEPVSLACVGSPTPHGIRVGPVYTPPDRRGRGYGSAVTAAASAAELAAGRRECFLFTDLANPVSNRIYTAIGYRPVVDIDRLAFRRAPGA